MRFRKKSTAADLTGVAKIGAYIRRAAHDPTVRDRGRVAIASTRSAYARIRKQKASAPALLNDKKLQRDLRRILEALRDAAARLTETSPTPSRRRVVAISGVVLGVVAAAALAWMWKDKLRSLFSGETTGTDDEAESQGAAETPVTAPPQVAPPGSEDPTVQVPLSPTDPPE